MNTEFHTDQCRSLCELPYPVRRNQYVARRRRFGQLFRHVSPERKVYVAAGQYHSCIRRQMGQFRCDNRTVTHLFAAQRVTNVSVEVISNLAPVSSNLPQRISALCLLHKMEPAARKCNCCPLFIWSILKPVAYPGIFFGGGVQQIQLRTEDRENGDLGVVTP